jgi:2,3-diketo-5-methylthio-1-phosphopentane phosphatase
MKDQQHLASAPPARRLRILCDFDGTISPVDTTDALLEALASPEWLEVEQDWAAGQIDSRTCMMRQARLLRGGWEDVHRVLDGLAIDPHFGRFAEFCSRAGHHLLVVSDGYEQAIARLLGAPADDVEVRANRLVRGSDGQWSLEAPFGAAACHGWQAHCKCLSLPPQRWRTIVIGDGRSDLCVARRADLVMARDTDEGPSRLLQACRDEGLPHRAFRSFADVIEAVAAWSEREVASCASA